MLAKLAADYGQADWPDGESGKIIILGKVTTSPITTTITRSHPPIALSSEAHEGTEGTLELTGSTQGSLITVDGGGCLTLQGITLSGLKNGESGGADTADNTAAVITVNSGGTLTMNASAVITSNAIPSSLGGGVYVHSGTFTKAGTNDSDDGDLRQ